MAGCLAGYMVSDYNGYGSYISNIIFSIGLEKKRRNLGEDSMR